jgi:hypothetical protein
MGQDFLNLCLDGLAILLVEGGSRFLRGCHELSAKAAVASSSSVPPGHLRSCDPTSRRLVRARP